jgi:Flp pilus assembly pilin Flp
MQLVDYITARLHHGEEGQTMAEYAVVLAVITVVIIGALTLLCGGIEEAFNKVTAIL